MRGLHTLYVSTDSWVVRLTRLLSWLSIDCSTLLPSSVVVSAESLVLQSKAHMSSGLWALTLHAREDRSLCTAAPAKLLLCRLCSSAAALRRVLSAGS